MGTFSREERIMRRVFGLAERGNGQVSPNPMVGCVLYQQGEKIGEGFHEVFGGPHAEVNAIGSVKNLVDLKGSELFVNLEPCCHFGKTPPCTDLIIRSGIGKVFISNNDPNEKVNGKGIAHLRAAGISVVSGIMENEGRELNRFFFTAHTKMRPYITVKIAQTLDGKIAALNGKSQWISNDLSRKDAQFLRLFSDALITGGETVRQDNPRLTVRLDGVIKQPQRIILTQSGKIPQDSLILRDKHSSKTVIFTTQLGSTSLSQILPEQVEVITLPMDEKEQLPFLLQTCFDRGLHKLLIEAGGVLISKLFELNVVDELVIYQAPKLMGDGNSWFTFDKPVISPELLDSFILTGIEKYGQDVKLKYRIKS